MTTASASPYRPRHPERTVLYRVMAQHFERFMQVYDERFAPTRGPLSPGAQEAVNRYLGRVARGSLTPGLPQIRT